MTANWTKQYMVDKAYRADVEARAQQMRVAQDCRDAKQRKTASHTKETEHIDKRDVPPPQVPSPLRPRRALVFGIIVAVLFAMLVAPSSSFAQDTSDQFDSGTDVGGFEYAIFYLQIGRYEWAVEILDAMIEEQPENPSAYAARGTCYYYMADYAQAIADSEIAIALAPSYSMPYWTLGDVYFDLGDYELARENYMKYVDLAIDHPHPYVLDQVQRCDR